MKRRPRPDIDVESTFLPQVASAADRAMQEVLDEDKLLRTHGIMPVNGRSR